MNINEVYLETLTFVSTDMEKKPTHQQTSKRKQTEKQKQNKNNNEFILFLFFKNTIF